MALLKLTESKTVGLDSHAHEVGLPGKQVKKPQPSRGLEPMGMGAQRFGNPTAFRFSNGAVIWTDNLTSSNSYEQYRGHEPSDMVIDDD